MYRNWFVRFVALVAVVGFFIMLRELVRHEHLANLYETQPCRYSGEMTDKAELAIRRLKGNCSRGWQKDVAPGVRN